MVHPVRALRSLPSALPFQNVTQDQEFSLTQLVSTEPVTLGLYLTASSSFSTTRFDSANSPDGNYSLKEVPFLPLYMRIWVTVIAGLIFIIGVGGNILVPVLFWRNKELRHPTNVFLLNLALADTLVLVLCLPIGIIEVHSPQHSWILGAALCHLVPFLELAVTRTSTMTLMIISIERYIAICWPLKMSCLCTKARAAAVCCFVWIFASLAAGPAALATKYEDSGEWTQCSTPLHQKWVTIYFLTSTCFFFAIPLVLLLFIYFMIGRKLLSHRARIRKREDGAQWKARTQVAAMLGAVVLVFFICLLPFHGLAVWIILSPVEDLKHVNETMYNNVLFISRIFFYLNSAVNPIIYNIMSSKFRTAMFQLFGIDASKSGRGLLRRRSTFMTMITSSTSSSRSSSFRVHSFRSSRRSSSSSACKTSSEQIGRRLSTSSSCCGRRYSSVSSRTAKSSVASHGPEITENICYNLVKSSADAKDLDKNLYCGTQFPALECGCSASQQAEFLSKTLSIYCDDSLPDSSMNHPYKSLKTLSKKVSFIDSVPKNGQLEVGKAVCLVQSDNKINPPPELNKVFSAFTSHTLISCPLHESELCKEGATTVNTDCAKDIDESTLEKITKSADVDCVNCTSCCATDRDASRNNSAPREFCDSCKCSSLASEPSVDSWLERAHVHKDFILECDLERRHLVSGSKDTQKPSFT